MKDIIRRTISRESVAQMDLAQIVAIFYAEVGAQGCSEVVATITDDGTRLLVDEGSFSYELNGTRSSGDVEIEAVEAKIPFLAGGGGVSPETTVRGHFRLPGDEWVHVDARVGRHFFRRSGYEDLFHDGMLRHRDLTWFDALLEQLKGADFFLRTPSKKIHLCTQCTVATCGRGRACGT